MDNVKKCVGCGVHKDIKLMLIIIDKYDLKTEYCSINCIYSHIAFLDKVYGKKSRQVKEKLKDFQNQILNNTKK